MRWTCQNINERIRDNKTKCTYCEDAVALLPCAIHLDIIKTPILDEPYGQIRFHDPRQDRIQQENYLDNK